MKNKLELRILMRGIAILFIGILFSTILVLYYYAVSVNDVVENKTSIATEIITKNIERTMLEASAEITGGMVRDLQSVYGVEEIVVINHEGREAFKKSGAIIDDRIIDRLSKDLNPITVKTSSNLTVYHPLQNRPQCKRCHNPDLTLVGAVKVTVPRTKEIGSIWKFSALIVISSLGGLVVLGLIFRWILKTLVIVPIKDIERASMKMAGGDLTFPTVIRGEDEIGKLNYAIKDSLYSISGILRRVGEISRRITSVATEVESDSDKVFKGTQLEAEAVSNISSSVEQLNAAITEIAENTEGLAASVEETAASVEEMSVSVNNVVSITNELSSGVESTSSSIEQLSATLKEVAGNAEELAHVSEETISAIEEIISSIKEVEQSSKESARLSEKTNEEASTLGVVSIEKTIEGMERIKRSVETAAGAVKKLGGRSEEIGKILNVIDDITEQTTLLALNAAILAAQAGERGKGFSVVADEIKDLAERTTFSTQEISSLIQSVQYEVKEAIDLIKEGLGTVDEGIMLSREAGESFRKILDSSKRSSEMTSVIENATTEQSKAARYVSESVERVRSMVGQIAKATSEQSKGINLIIKATEVMRDAATQVTKAIDEQAVGSKEISRAIELVSDRTQQISLALNEQKLGSNQIYSSIESIKELPANNRTVAFRINKSLRELFQDAEFVSAEIERFSLYEETEKEIITMGVAPLESPAIMYRKFNPLAQYLGEKIGKKVELKIPSNFAAAVDDLGSGETQLCYLTPSTFIEASIKYDIELLAKALRDGKPYHHSIIIARDGGSINSIADIRGRSFAFGDKHSTSSHIVPRAMLFKEGIELKDLTYYNYLDHHDDVARAILKDEFDAGGVMESTAYKYQQEGLKFIKVSEEIPEFNICASASLSVEDAELIKGALMELNEPTESNSQILTAIDAKYTGLSEATAYDYNNIKLMMSKMGMI